MGKTTGVLRGFDKAGRFVLPAEMVKTLDLKQTDLLEISCDGTKITLRKHEPFCILSGEQDGRFIEVNGKKISERMAVEIASRLEVMNNA